MPYSFSLLAFAPGSVIPAIHPDYSFPLGKHFALQSKNKILIFYRLSRKNLELLKKKGNQTAATCLLLRFNRSFTKKELPKGSSFHMIIARDINWS